MSHKAITKQFKTPFEITSDTEFANSAFIICFYGSEYPYSKLYNALMELKVPFIGCMDIARLEGNEYIMAPDSAVAMCLPKEMVEAVSVVAYDMRKSCSYDAIRLNAKDQFVRGMEKAGIQSKAPDLERDLAINLLYGLQSANPVLEALTDESLFLQSVGGSSGGKLDFKSSNVISSKGRGAIGATAFIRLKEEYFFQIERVSSFEKQNSRLTVTKLASPRHILEFNGKPAQDEFASAVGKSPAEFSPSLFAQFTLGVEPGDGEKLITSIMKEDGTGGILTYNDVMPETVFNVYRAISQKEDRTSKMQRMDGQRLAAYMSFDCVLCYLARESANEIHLIEEVYAKNLPNIPKIGFGTFSENFCGANVNQTETFLAIYKR